MAVNVVYSNQAQIDIHKAKCYFDLIEKGEAFLDDLFYVEELICIMPEMFQIKYNKIRIANLNHFTFAIHYVYEGDTVYVYRVYSAGKDIV